MSLLLLPLVAFTFTKGARCAWFRSSIKWLATSWGHIFFSAANWAASGLDTSCGAIPSCELRCLHHRNLNHLSKRPLMSMRQLVSRCLWLDGFSLLVLQSLKWADWYVSYFREHLGIVLGVSIASCRVSCHGVSLNDPCMMIRQQVKVWSCLAVDIAAVRVDVLDVSRCALDLCALSVWDVRAVVAVCVPFNRAQVQVIDHNGLPRLGDVVVVWLHLRCACKLCTCK